MKWLKKNIFNIILVLIFMVGVGLILYPSVSDYWNKLHQSRAIASYSEVVAQMDNSEMEAMLADAVAYNERLAHSVMNLKTDSQDLEEYNSLLDATGTGIMGYIEIDQIKCYLPIYHSTDESVLQVAVGHITGTSLPVGGESTHCVLSGHRGLPSAKLFSDLDKMALGDTFVIRTLDEVLTYEVDQILIVEPAETDALRIEEGKDLCTLVTCTPYGVNTHRLLVRGHRVENAASAIVIRVTSEAMQIEAVIVAALIAIPILLFLIILVLYTGRRERKNQDRNDAAKKSYLDSLGIKQKEKSPTEGRNVRIVDVGRHTNRRKDKKSDRKSDGRK